MWASAQRIEGGRPPPGRAGDGFREVGAGLDDLVRPRGGFPVGSQHALDLLVGLRVEGRRPVGDVLAEEGEPLDVREVPDEPEQVVPEATPGVRTCGSGTPSIFAATEARR